MSRSIGEVVDVDSFVVDTSHVQNVIEGKYWIERIVIVEGST